MKASNLDLEVLGWPKPKASWIEAEVNDDNFGLKIDMWQGGRLEIKL